MPTTEELYQRLIAPGKRERGATAHIRAMKRSEHLVRAVVKKPVCKHYLKGQWTVYHTKSGKTMGKCGRCGCGFLIDPL